MVIVIVVVGITACTPGAGTGATSSPLDESPTSVINLLPGALDTSTPTATLTPSATSLPTQTASPTAPCKPKAAFIDDISVPDGTPISPGSRFTKVWRVKNDSDCPWTESFSLVQVSGTKLHAENLKTPLPFVAPNASIDLSATVSLSLDAQIGSNQRAAFDLRDSSGAKFANLTILVSVVEGTPSAPNDTTVSVGSQSIDGIVWSDYCHPSTGSADPEKGKCVPTAGGGRQADGVRQTTETGIAGVTVNLSGGACPGGAVADASVKTDQSGAYYFTNLGAGSYCIWVDSLSLANGPILVPGSWSVVVGLYNDNNGRAESTVIIAVGESGTTVNFGWDFQLD